MAMKKEKAKRKAPAAPAGRQFTVIVTKELKIDGQLVGHHCAQLKWSERRKTFTEEQFAALAAKACAFQVKPLTVEQLVAAINFDQFMEVIVSDAPAAAPQEDEPDDEG